MVKYILHIVYIFIKHPIIYSIRNKTLLMEHNMNRVVQYEGRNAIRHFLKFNLKGLTFILSASFIIFILTMIGKN